LTSVEIILGFSTRACNSIKPQVKKGDLLDVREYVKVIPSHPPYSLITKIKVIPDGTVDECTYIDGIAFTKNIAHKKLQSSIDNPRVLLLQAGLEYPTNASRR
jgi:1-phosphatidylinositol-3-phosphate 5-kinase